MSSTSLNFIKNNKNKLITEQCGEPKQSTFLQQDRWMKRLAVNEVVASPTYLLEEFDIKAVRAKALWGIKAPEIQTTTKGHHTRAQTGYIFDEDLKLQTPKMVYIKDRISNIGHQTKRHSVAGLDYSTRVRPSHVGEEPSKPTLMQDLRKMERSFAKKKTSVVLLQTRQP